MKPSNLCRAWPLIVPLVLFSSGALVSAASSENAISREEAEGIIFERQNVMKQLEKDTELLGDILAGLAPADQLGPVTASIAESARTSQELFAMKVPGGRAKDAVWTEHDAYMTRMADFTTSTARLAELGAAGDVPGVTGQLITALPCKQCHDAYREKKN